MAAAIVYDGAGKGGTLFEDKKFWVAQRVPSRSRWVDLITSNGGQIVHLEKQADLLIADHARKDAVPGSYSWTWIEQSVKKGMLEDLENHRAGPVEKISRLVGSSVPSRVTRTPFTAADDRALARWVTDAELKGLSTKGNSIYQQLERCNPRHTSQSWRDRWIKVLQFQTRPAPTSSSPAPGPVLERPSTTRHNTLSNGSTAKSARTLSGNVKPQLRTLPLSRSPSPLRNLSQGNLFTEDDRNLLLGYYNDIENVAPELAGEAWNKFAEQNPHHTAQEWFKYWIDEIRPLRTPGYQKSTKRKPRVPLIQSNRGDSPQVSENSTKSHGNAPIPEPQPSRGQESSRYIELQKERFFNTLAEFAEAQEKEVDFEPTVSGRQIQLFDLWNIVKKPEFDDSDDDADDTGKWSQAASVLGFDTLQDSSAPVELAKLYDWILADFAQARAAYRVCLNEILANGGELTEEQMIDFEYLTPPDHEKGKPVKYQALEDSNDDPELLDIPSSPPQRLSHSEKRGYELNDSVRERSLSQQPDIAPHKRRRVDKGKGKVLEIPSTPDDLLSFNTEAYGSSPVKGQDLIQGDEEADVSEEEDGMFVKPVQRRIFSKTSIRIRGSKTVQLEPETQDFRFSQTVEGANSQPQSQHVQEDILAGAESVAAVAGSIREDSSTQSQTDSQREGAEVREFLDHYIALGYPELVVRDAMLATTLETGDVATVMEDIMRGVGIPQNIEGVWTAEDDHAVRMIENNQEYARVVLKHGEARCVRRRQFLSDLELQ